MSVGIEGVAHRGLVSRPVRQKHGEQSMCGTGGRAAPCFWGGLITGSSTSSVPCQLLTSERAPSCFPCAPFQIRRFPPGCHCNSGVNGVSGTITQGCKRETLTHRHALHLLVAVEARNRLAGLLQCHKQKSRSLPPIHSNQQDDTAC